MILGPGDSKKTSFSSLFIDTTLSLQGKNQLFSKVAAFTKFMLVWLRGNSGQTAREPVVVFSQGIIWLIDNKFLSYLVKEVQSYLYVCQTTFNREEKSKSCLFKK